MFICHELVFFPTSLQRYNPEDQPWLLQEDGPAGRKYKGVKEGGVTENTSYYIFQQAGSGAFEAFPIEVRYFMRDENSDCIQMMCH